MTPDAETGTTLAVWRGSLEVAMFPLFATVFEVSSWYESLARLASAVALWASVKAEHRQPTPEEAMDDLTLRLRSPRKYWLRRIGRLFTLRPL